MLYDFGGMCDGDGDGDGDGEGGGGGGLFLVRSGEEVIVLPTDHNRICGWYQCKNSKGQVFFLPSNYLVGVKSKKQVWVGGNGELRREKEE